jgi:hypothetical protein
LSLSFFSASVNSRIVAAAGAAPKYLTFQLVPDVSPGASSFEVPAASTLNRFYLALMKVWPKFIFAVGNSHSWVYLFLTIIYVRSSAA